MATSIPAKVTPAVLTWARRSVDLSTLAASRKLGFDDDRVAVWEDPDEAQLPTIAQLRKAAELYRVALAVFFLPEPPPRSFDVLRDFRRHDGARAGAWTPELHGEYRRALLQRDHLLELAEIDDVAPSKDWHIDPLPTGDDEIADAARSRLLAVAPLSLPTAAGTPYDHLNAWVAALETAGVLVMATTGGQVAPQEMRGFSLHFDEVPVIVVNGADFPRGRLFTLLHEYVHLLLRIGGLCDTVSDLQATTPDRALEARCNAIAAGILMPAAAVLIRPQVRERAERPEHWDYESLAEAAGPFGVSAEAFLRRLLTLQQVPLTFYQEQRERFLARYEEEAGRDRPRGGNYYRTTVRDLGKGYVRRVADAHARRIIDSYTAANFLNVKVGQIARLAQTADLRTVV